MSIVDECMVVNLQIGTWTGTRLDKEISRKLTDEAYAEEDAARVSKRLVSREVLRPIGSAANSARAHFYSMTVPWKDNGDRLLTRTLYTRFMEEHAEKMREFDEAVEHFLNYDYPSAQQQGKFRMGELYMEDDYPQVEKLRDKFYMRIDIDAVTDAQDIRVKLSKHEDKDRLVREAEEAMQRRIGKAMGYVWEELGQTLRHFAERMDGDKTFRDTTLTNLQTLIDTLPGLNVINDPNLDRISKELAQVIGSCSGKQLRKDAKLRESAAIEAQRIITEMEGFMNAFKVAA